MDRMPCGKKNSSAAEEGACGPSLWSWMEEGQHQQHCGPPPRGPAHGGPGGWGSGPNISPPRMAGPPRGGPAHGGLGEWGSGLYMSPPRMAGPPPGGPKHGGPGGWDSGPYLLPPVMAGGFLGPFGGFEMERGPPPHVVQFLMKKWSEDSDDEEEDREQGSQSVRGGPPAHVRAFFKRMHENNEHAQKNQVMKAEKPLGGEEGRPGGMCWKQWMQAGKKPDVWFRVIQCPDIEEQKAEVSITDHALVISGIRNDDSSSSEEGSVLKQSVPLPRRIIERTARTSWLGPHRLLAFGFKRPKESGEDGESQEEMAQGCWCQSVHLPGYQGADISAKIDGDKVIVHALKISHDEETGDSDHMESTRVVSLPDGLRRRSLRLARMGPMRVMLFALLKKQKPEETEAKQSKVCEEDDTDNREHEKTEDEDDEGSWVKPIVQFKTEVNVTGFSVEELKVKRTKRLLVVSGRHEELGEDLTMKRTISLPADVIPETVRICVDREAQMMTITAQRSVGTLEDDGGEMGDEANIVVD